MLSYRNKRQPSSRLTFLWTSCACCIPNTMGMRISNHFRSSIGFQTTCTPYEYYTTLSTVCAAASVATQGSLLGEIGSLGCSAGTRTGHLVNTEHHDRRHQKRQFRTNIPNPRKVERFLANISKFLDGLTLNGSSKPLLKDLLLVDGFEFCRYGKNAVDTGSLRQSTAVYGNLRQSTAIYGNLRQSTAIYGSLRHSTAFYGILRHFRVTSSLSKSLNRKENTSFSLLLFVS
jgi:hypothetical protein